MVKQTLQLQPNKRESKQPQNKPSPKKRPQDRYPGPNAADQTPKNLPLEIPEAQNQRKWNTQLRLKLLAIFYYFILDVLVYDGAFV